MRLFVNTRKVKSILWGFNVLAVLGVLFVLVTILNKEREGEYKARSSVDFSNKMEAGATVERGGPRGRKDVLSYSSLWNARIDGSVRASLTEVANTDTSLIPENEPLENVLELSMILHTPDAPEQSKVRVRYLKDVTVEKTLSLDLWSKEGDHLKPPYDAAPSSGKILRIGEKQVVFAWFGREVVVGPKSFQSDADRNLATSRGEEGFPEDPLKTYRKNPPEETEEFREGHFAISSQEYNQVTKGYEKLLDEVKLTTYSNPETGKEAIKLASVEQDSLVHRRGFRRNDILISINGIPISSKAAAVNYFKQHPKEGRYVVEIDRMGRRVYKTFIYDN